MITRAERTRIAAGDYSPLQRETKPDLAEGSTHPVVWSRGTRFADGPAVIRVPPLPTLTITIRKVVRHRSGGWRVHFDVYDRRELRRLVRRVPPALREGDYRTPTPTEIEMAHEESNYTQNPQAAVDHLESVPATYQNVIAIDARKRFAEHQERHRAEEVARRDVRAVNAQIRETAITLARSGGDAHGFLVDIQRRIESQRDGQNAA